MQRNSLFPGMIAAILPLIFASCNFSSAAINPPATPLPQTIVTNTPPNIVTDIATSRPAGDAVEILSVSPPVPAGISIADPVTVSVRYNLTLPSGLLQVWFERFADADCTETKADTTTGATTIAGTLDPVNGGARDATISVPPLPLLETSYVGVGVRLWTPDGGAIVVEDMRYNVCYAVNEPPADMTPSSSESEPISGATAGTGAVLGTVFNDLNGSGRKEAGESGSASIQIILADLSCGATLASTRTDSAGNFSFFGLPPGTFCVMISYSAGTVLPGYWQRVTVRANNNSYANFALQPAASPSSPPASGGYCGDGTVNAGLGEQCDPPNLTNCTASCQTYIGFCGDGYVDAGLGEQCDPPNTTDCTASCQTYVPYCGDGYVDTGVGEQCDPPNLTNCTASCQTYTPVCGDGYVDTGFGEQCDPPNVDFCTASCQLYVPNCGNGTLEAGEECDPPNTTNCTAQCQNWP
jgi:hypothetical protein